MYLTKKYFIFFWGGDGRLEGGDLKCFGTRKEVVEGENKGEWERESEWERMREIKIV